MNAYIEQYTLQLLHTHTPLFQRPAFINQVIGFGMEQSISTENAAKLILRHIGDDHSDVHDALLLLAQWPAVAKKVKTITGISLEIPQYSGGNDSGASSGENVWNGF